MKTLFKTIFGSHLYGTDTPSSDKDYKGVFIEDFERIILKTDRNTINESSKVSSTAKNSKDDTDVEMIELRRFINDCLVGQTYALDMLFAPNQFHLESSPEWDYIISNRNKLLSKNVAPYIGYCRQQAGKYGLKGSRLGELIKIIELLQSQHQKARLEDILEIIMTTFNGSEYIEVVDLEHKPNKDKEPVFNKYLKVLGKHFPVKNFVKDTLSTLELMSEKYGNRARLAADNQGVDWKAISHAYRCMYQLKELAETGNINFPLQDSEYLKLLKKGLVPYSVIHDELPIIMEDAIAQVLNSKILPQQPDRDFWNKFLVNTYIQQKS